MTGFNLFRSRDVIRRFQSKPSGLMRSALVLLTVSFVADLFPLGVMAGTSFTWAIVRMILQSFVTVILVTWMWIVWSVLIDSLIKRKVFPNFPVVRAVLILSFVAMAILNAVPYANTSGGHSIGWPFRFVYGTTVVSPFAAILDLAHALIVVALLLVVADRAAFPRDVHTETPATPILPPAQ